MPNSIYLFEVLYNVVYGLPQSKVQDFALQLGFTWRDHGT